MDMPYGSRLKAWRGALMGARLVESAAKKATKFSLCVTPAPHSTSPATLASKN